MCHGLSWNGTIVSLDPDVGQYDDGGLLIEDGEIVEIGRGLTSAPRLSKRRQARSVNGRAT